MEIACRTQADAGQDGSEILAWLQNILASPWCRDAPSARRFLQHVVQHKLDGEELSLKEYSIGVEAKPGFDIVGYFPLSIRKAEGPLVKRLPPWATNTTPLNSLLTAKSLSVAAIVLSAFA